MSNKTANPIRGIGAGLFEVNRHVTADEIISKAITILRNRHKRGSTLTSPNAVRELLTLEYAAEQREVFAAIFLDNRHRVIHREVLSTGTIDSAAVYPREVVRRCIELNAAAVIFCHNHPSGVAEPSDTDVKLTRKLTDALSLIDVRVLDHMIVATGAQTSLAERGLM